jgi:hypothetical protein
MAFNPNTFNLTKAATIIEAWQQALKALRNAPERVFSLSPATTHGRAVSLLLQFNKVRAAMRAQWPDGHQFDYIVVSKKEVGDGLWQLTFREYVEPSFSIVDEQGEPVT